MAWTTPMTAVAGSFTAAQWNTYVRDNLNQTAPALAANVGSMFVGTGSHALAERQIKSAYVANMETTTTTSYGDNLAHTGPSVTITTGTFAIVSFYVYQGNLTAGSAAQTTVQVSGATTIAAADDWYIAIDGLAASSTSGSGDNMLRLGRSVAFNLTAGSNTFKMVYKCSSGTGVFADRKLVVWAF